jgi:cyclomaltodextrinase
MSQLQLGRYRHFKGNEYAVLGIARDSDTMTEMVVYRALYGERGLWVRPLSMFTAEVERDGRRMPRFQYIGPDAGTASIG